MVKDLVNSIKVQLYERATSPLLGAFVISWALWNYRFLLVLLSSSLPIQDKFSIIDNTIFTNKLIYITHGFLGPLFTALAFIFIYPIPAKTVYLYARSKQKELKEARQKIDNETLLTKEEARALRLKLIQMEQTYKEEVDQLSQENQDLKSEITNLNKKRGAEENLDELISRNQDASISNRIVPPNYEKDMLSIGYVEAQLLSYLVDENQPMKQSWLLDKIRSTKKGIDISLVINALDKLDAMGFIEKAYDRFAGETLVSITDYGRHAPNDYEP